MTSSFVPVRRIAALSVAITLFAAPIAAAQSLDASSPPAKTTLLSPRAFSRLVHAPQTEVVPTVVASDESRPSLLSQVTAAMAREARTTAAPAKAPQQKSWASRHKVAIIVWSAVAVTAALFGYWVYVGGQHDE